MTATDNTSDGWIEPSAETEPFFAGARDGVLRLQHCKACDGLMYPLRQTCQQCGSADLNWQDASGNGTLFSYARLRREYHPRHKDRLPIVICWIDLAEGVRVPGNLVDSNDQPFKVGAAVRVDFEQDPAGVAFPVYRLV